MGLISGSLGGIKEKKKEKDNKESIQKFKKKTILLDNFEGFSELKKSQKIQEVTLFINNTCNLNCPYCYVERLSDDPKENISNEQWLSFLSDAIDDGVKTISIVGKEPFIIPEKTIDFLERLNNINDGKINKGLVSNLTLMTPKIAKSLSAINNLYIDVSIDGLPNIHNKNRGNGSFEKTLKGIGYLKDAGITDIFVSHLLYKDNAETLCDSVNSLCERYDLKKFSIFPLCDFGDKDPLSISGSEYCDVIENILDNKLKMSGIEIIFKTDYTEPEVMLAVLDKFIRRDEIKEDKNGVLYNMYKDNNLNTYYLNFSPFPCEFISTLRINHKGGVTFCANMNDEIVNIKDGYNAVKECVSSQEVEVFYQNYFNRVRLMMAKD